MSRTTPPPPLDITTVFPELGRLARPAVRLHPRAGAPGRGDSSLGGPLLWPADTPWPVCREPFSAERREPIAPADLQRFRAILDAAHRRWRPGQALEDTVQEAAEMDRIMAGAGSLDLTAGERVYREPQPHRDSVALVPVLQLYAHDVPDLPFPNHTNLFQLLWCPNDHDAPWWGPCPVTVWRRAADVAEPLSTPPAPRFEDDWFARDYVPLPCVLHPERVVEYPHPCGVPAQYPHPCNLPVELAERIERRDERHDERTGRRCPPHQAPRSAATHAGTSPRHGRCVAAGGAWSTCSLSPATSSDPRGAGCPGRIARIPRSFPSGAASWLGPHGRPRA
jgi:hypothetical protein